MGRCGRAVNRGGVGQLWKRRPLWSHEGDRLEERGDWRPRRLGGVPGREDRH